MGSPNERSIDFIEGFRVIADDLGLRIQVTDYHARELRLGYSQIEHLRRSRSTEQPPGKIETIETAHPPHDAKSD